VLRELQKKKLHAQSMWVLAHMIVWIAKTSVCAEGFALGSAFINSSRGFESPVIIGDHDFWARRLVPGGDNCREDKAITNPKTVIPVVTYISQP
jgi:hypothetical protein